MITDKTININKINLSKTLNIYGAELPNIRYAFMQKRDEKIFAPTNNTEPQKRSENFWLNTILYKHNSIFFKEIERKIIKEIRQKEDIHYTIICGNVNKWIQKNALINPTHNLFYRNKFLTKALGFYCRENPSYVHFCKYKTENYNVTYEVIQEINFVENLNNWNDYQIANLTQRPFTELYTSNDKNIKEALEKNLRNTVSINKKKKKKI